MVRLMAWARATFAIPDDVVTMQVGSVEGAACLWLQRPHPDDEARYSTEYVLVPQFPTMESLRAAFVTDEGGQLRLDFLA